MYSLDTIAQIGIVFFGLSAVILVASKNKWGFVMGLLSEPFWVITSYLHNQWGIILLAVVYSGSWIYGIYVWFFKKEKK